MQETETWHMPTTSDLRHLPLVSTAVFRHLAVQTLRRYLYPRLLLLRHRTRRVRAMTARPVKALPTHSLARHAMFERWPADLLEQLARNAVPTVFFRHEYILYEGECAQSGIYFLMTGASSVLKKRTPERKGCGGDNAVTLATLDAGDGTQAGPFVVGEFAFLTEEPRMASIQALSRVDCWA
eukprot:gene11071-54652_t